MNSENLLQNLVKHSHYGFLRSDFNILMIFVGTISGLAGIVFILTISFNKIMLIIGTGFLLCMIISAILGKYKIITQHQISTIIATYTYFIFTPALWCLGNGLSESAPYFIIMITIINIIMLSGKIQKIYLLGYIITIIGLSVYSYVTANATGVPLDLLTVKLCSFFLVLFLIIWILLYGLKRYDEMFSSNVDMFIKDELTEMLGRRMLDTIIEYMESQYIQQKKDYILVMLDIDNFKKFNDEYGHTMGDIMLRNVAACMIENVRKSDFVIRYGGDEIVIIFPHTTLKRVMSIISRIQKVIEKLVMFDFKPTFSFGWAARSECDNYEKLIPLADKRMYKNKENWKVEELN